MYLDCGPCAIRSWRRGDEASLVRHADNRKIWLNVRDAFPHPYTLIDADWWIEHATSRVPETAFAIEVDGEAAGGIGFTLQEDVERCAAEIGYWLGEAHWGRGIATAALRALTAYAFATHGLARVYAIPFARNTGSIRVLEKAGYVFEAVMRRSAVKEGVVLDQLLYARTDDQPAPAERLVQPARPVGTATAEHYRWGDGCDGWFLARSAAQTVIQERMPPGAAEVRHYHERAWQFFYVLAGELLVEVDSAEHRLAAGTGIEVPPLSPHQVRNRSGADVHFLVVSRPDSHGDRVPEPR